MELGPGLREVVELCSLEVFKKQPDVALSATVQLTGDESLKLDLMTSEVFSNLIGSMKPNFHPVFSQQNHK